MTWCYSLSLMTLSFLPLWLLVLARSVYVLCFGEEGARIAERCSAIGVPVMVVISALVAHSFFQHLRIKKSRGVFKIRDCKEEKTITLEFLAANVFPLLCFDSTTGEGLALTLTYFFILASLSIRHRYFPANIWLEWLGWTFWRCKVENSICPGHELDRVIVSRNRIIQGEERQFVSINNETLIDFRQSGKSSDSE